MMFVVLYTALLFLKPETIAANQEDHSITENPVNSSNCSETNQLLDGLISEIIIFKFSVLLDMKQQLASQTEIIDKLLSRLDEMEANRVKLVDDNQNLRETIASLLSGTMAEQKTGFSELKHLMIISISDGNSKNQQSLKNISAAVENLANRTKQISDNLQMHDQRLQNFTNKDICKTAGESNSSSTSTTSSLRPISTTTPTSTSTSTSTSSPTSTPRDCSDIKKTGPKPSGVYRIYLQNGTAINVYCDFDTSGGDYLVFQRRKDGSGNFSQTWNSYQNGFGSVYGEFYLGNEIIYQLASYRKCKLRIDLEDFEGQKSFAEYATFSIGPASDYYRLNIGPYWGNAGDSLTYSNKQQFSTIDADHDSWSASCAKYSSGGWWYNNCMYCNLNGKYYKVSNTNGYYDGIVWVDWHGWLYSLKTAEMKIALLN